MPRDAFPGYDEPVNIDLEFEDALRVVLDAPSPEADTECEDPSADDSHAE